MVRLGITNEAMEPTDWFSPMVNLPKKGGSVRLCVDYANLNKSVERERYQTPLAVAKLSGARFSLLWMKLPVFGKSPWQKIAQASPPLSLRSDVFILLVYLLASRLHKRFPTVPRSRFCRVSTE